MFSQNSLRVLPFNMLQHRIQAPVAPFLLHFIALASPLPIAQLQKEAQIYEPLGSVSHREIGLPRCNVHCSLFSDVVFELYTLLCLSFPSFIELRAIKQPLAIMVQDYQSNSHSPFQAIPHLSLFSFFFLFYLGSDLYFRVPPSLETVRQTLCGRSVCVCFKAAILVRPSTSTSAFTFPPSVLYFSALHSSRSDDWPLAHCQLSCSLR